jgi:hypothetical protein
MAKVCFLYQGRRFDHSDPRWDDFDRKSREIEDLEKVKNLIVGERHDYYFALTTWESENISDYFKILGQDLYINLIKEPEQKLIDEFLKSGLSEGKNLVNYHKQLYMRYKSIDTLNKFKNKLGFDFDVVVLLRTETMLWKNISGYYNLVNENDNSVYVASAPNFSVFGKNINDLNSSCPDTLFFSNQEVMFKLLNQLLNAQYTKINNMYHPETSQMRYFQYLNLNVVRLEFDAFVGPRKDKNGKIFIQYEPVYK